MSYSTLYRIYKTKATRFQTFRNSHGTGPVVWGFIMREYYKKDQYDWLHNMNLIDESLRKDNFLPDYVRTVLAFTFYYGVCPIKKLDQLINHLEKFNKICIFPNEYSNHWPAIQFNLKNHKPLARQLAVGLNCTSVEDYWNNDYKDKAKLWNVLDLSYLYE